MCNHPDAAMEWVGRGASAPGRHQAACQLQSLVGRLVMFKAVHAQPCVFATRVQPHGRAIEEHVRIDG